MPDSHHTPPEILQPTDVIVLRIRPCRVAFEDSEECLVRRRRYEQRNRHSRLAEILCCSDAITTPVLVRSRQIMISL